MVLNVQELRKKIEGYFKTVTKDQLLKDLVDSGLEVYSKSEYKIGEVVASEKKDQKIIAIIGGANNVDFLCGTVRTGTNIVRASYPCGVERIRTANKETNTNVPGTTPTSASPLDWSQYEYQFGT